MGFATAVRTCFAKYFVFEGRAPRSEFWWFQLFWVVAMALPIVAMASMAEKQIGPALGIAVFVLYVALIPPTIAVTVRRLHDRNRSGWNYWWVLMPFFGALVVLIWCCQRGMEGSNRFGLDPLHEH